MRNQVAGVKYLVLYYTSLPNVAVQNNVKNKSIWEAGDVLVMTQFIHNKRIQFSIVCG